MKASKVLVLALALVASIYAANYLVGCSEERSSNPITSVAPATDNSETSADSVEGRKDQVQQTVAAINWNSLSAMSKRQLILEKAYSENGLQLTQYNCKTWASHIVRAASGNVAYLPSTCPSATGYYYCSPLDHVTQILQNQSASYTYFVPGRVLQMWYGGPDKPHTAFIWSSSSMGMEWIDCNFVKYPSPSWVGIHYISWADFYKKVYAYTLYEVF